MFFATGTFTAWSFLSVLWAAEPGEALGKSGLLAIYILCIWYALDNLHYVRGAQLLRVSRWIIICFSVGLAYLLFEELTLHALKTAFFNLVPAWRPSDKHLEDIADGALTVRTYISNRNVGMMLLMLWPAVLLARATLVTSVRQMQAALVLVACAGAIASLSQHETSVLALLLSGFIFLLARYVPRVALAVLAGGWLIATLAVVPIVSHAFNATELHKASWIPNSGRHRIVIWGYIAERVPERMFTGIGAASMKAVDAKRGSQVDTVSGTPYQWRSSPHAHNVYLQVWYELGSIGAILFALAGLAVIAAIAALPTVALPYGAATMTASAVMGGMTWGLWQPWFQAAFTVAVILLGIAVRASSVNREEV